MVSDAQKAIELSPSFAYAHSLLGAGLAIAGRGGSIDCIDFAIKLSPRDIWREEFDLHYSMAQFQAGLYCEAAGSAKKALIPRPGHLWPRVIRTASLGQLGSDSHSEDCVAKIRELVPGGSIESFQTIRLYVQDADHNRLIEGLRKAGLPES